MQLATLAPRWSPRATLMFAGSASLFLWAAATWVANFIV
jgi:hypothetical protein